MYSDYTFFYCNVKFVVWEWAIQELIVIAEHHLVLGVFVFEGSYSQVTWRIFWRDLENEQ